MQAYTWLCKCGLESCSQKQGAWYRAGPEQCYTVHKQSEGMH